MTEPDLGSSEWLDAFVEETRRQLDVIVAQGETDMDRIRNCRTSSDLAELRDYFQHTA